MENKYVIVRDKKRTFTIQEKGSQLIKQKGKCDCCGKYLMLEEAIGGHRLAWAKGNKSDPILNLVVLCFECNSEQSDMDYEEFKANLKKL
jgi:predicted ATP-dependent serine protease